MYNETKTNKLKTTTNTVQRVSCSHRASWFFVFFFVSFFSIWHIEPDLQSAPEQSSLQGLKQQSIKQAGTETRTQSFLYMFIYQSRNNFICSQAIKASHIYDLLQILRSGDSPNINIKGNIDFTLTDDFRFAFLSFALNENLVRVTARLGLCMRRFQHFSVLSSPGHSRSESEPSLNLTGCSTLNESYPNVKFGVF